MRQKKKNWAEQNAVEPGYNDIGLYDTPFTRSDFVVHLISSLITKTISPLLDEQPFITTQSTPLWRLKRVPLNHSHIFRTDVTDVSHLQFWGVTSPLCINHNVKTSVKTVKNTTNYLIRNSIRGMLLTTTCFGHQVAIVRLYTLK
jgi:hypothetical protein